MILIKFVFNHISIVVLNSRNRIINNCNLFAIINLAKINKFKIIWCDLGIKTIILNFILITEVCLIHLFDEIVHWDFSCLFGFDYLNCGNVVIILETLTSHQSTAVSFVYVDWLSYEVTDLKHIKLWELEHVWWVHQSCKKLGLIQTEQLLVIVGFHIQ